MDNPSSSARALPEPLSAETIRWGTAGGEALPFEVCELEGPWPSLPALYIFAKRMRVSWDALYIGQARDLQERLADHEAWSAALQKGMTAVHVHLHTGGISERTADESALVLTFNPLLNAQGLAGPDSGVLYFDRRQSQPLASAPERTRARFARGAE